MIFFTENLPMRCGTTYNASRVLRTIRITPECHKTTHLWLSSAATELPETVVKLFLCPFKAVGVLNIPSHVPSIHPITFGAQVPLASKSVTYSLQFCPFRASPDPVIFFAENLPMGCDTTYNASRVLCIIWIALECFAFWGNSDGTKYQGCIISRVASHKKVLSEKYDWTRMSHKTVKIEGYKSRF